MQECQLVVNNFGEKMNLRFNSTVYKQQLGIAKNLLKEYSYADLNIVFCYLRLFPTKNKIMSLGYIPYIIEEVLPKAKHYFKQEEDKLTPKIIVEVPQVEIKNEVIGKKSMFSKNRRF